MSILSVNFSKNIYLEKYGFYNEVNTDTRLSLNTIQNTAIQTILTYTYPASPGEGTTGAFFGKCTGGFVGIFFGFFGDLNSLYFIGDSTGTSESPYKIVDGAAITGTQWVYTAAIWDGGVTSSGMHIFKGTDSQPIKELTNVVLQNDGSGTALFGAGEEMHIGNIAGQTATFSGNIGYVARWNRVLSLYELRKAQQYGPLTVPQGLILCWSGDRDYSLVKQYAITDTASKNGVRPPPNNYLGRFSGNSPLLFSTAPAPPAVGYLLVKN